MPWSLKPGDPFASGLVIAIMFDQGTTTQIDGFSSPITLNQEGSPITTTTAQGDALLAAHSGPTGANAVTFNNQWMTALGRSVTTPFTISTGFYGQAFNATYQYSGPHNFSGGASNYLGGTLLWLDTGGFFAGIGKWDLGVDVGPLVEDQYYEYVIVIDDPAALGQTRGLVWLDGGFVSTYTHPVTPNLDSNCFIGRAFDSSGNYSFSKPITDFFMWDYAFTSQNVSDHFANRYSFMNPPGGVPQPNKLFFGANF